MRLSRHGRARYPPSTRKPDVAPPCGSVAGTENAEKERLQANFGRGRSRKRRSRTKPRGRARPQRSHLPAVRAVSGICEGVVERAKIALLGSRFKKSQTFQGKRRGCTKKVHRKRKNQQVQRWVKNSEFTEKNSLQAEKLASCLLKSLYFTAPEIQPESAGRSSTEII